MKCVDCKKNFKKEDMFYDWIGEQYYCEGCKELLKEHLVENENWDILTELDL